MIYKTLEAQKKTENKAMFYEVIIKTVSLKVSWKKTKVLLCYCQLFFDLFLLLNKIFVTCEIHQTYPFIQINGLRLDFWSVSGKKKKRGWWNDAKRTYYWFEKLSHSVQPDLVHRGVGQHLLECPHGQRLLQYEAADGQIWRDVLKYTHTSTDTHTRPGKSAEPREYE